ncbi:helix-turn-helix domain-containing protein, partial [Evtepia gabavorous]|uniref:helix-turn-helix domain-containing protein n=1 Tax=Evtepia gabavorous TaxID=2211183 RepID=UPI003A8ED86F
MGKYAPVIKTAECGSMTRAAQTMGYTQPSLGYIINNIENKLGITHGEYNASTTSFDRGDVAWIS